jgi:hypothetical protein
MTSPSTYSTERTEPEISGGAKEQKKEQRKMRILSRRKYFSRLMKKHALVKKNRRRKHADKNKEQISQIRIRFFWYN